MKTIEEYIAEIQGCDNRKLAELYVPAIRRCVERVGWDAVRRWLYSYEDTKWYADLLENMTTSEQLEEDGRRLELLKQMAVENAALINLERAFIQEFITMLISQLLGKI